MSLRLKNANILNLILSIFCKLYLQIAKVIIHILNYYRFTLFLEFVSYNNTRYDLCVIVWTQIHDSLDQYIPWFDQTKVLREYISCKRPSKVLGHQILICGEKMYNIVSQCPTLTVHLLATMIEEMYNSSEPTSGSRRHLHKRSYIT